MKKKNINDENEIRVETRKERRKKTREIEKAIAKVENSDTDTVKEPATMKTAVIRVSRINHIKEDNEKLGLKAGDVLEITYDDIKKIINSWSNNKEMDYFYIMHDEDADNIHYHAVISFDSPPKFSTIKNKFPYGKIDSVHTSVSLSVQYLIHQNNPEKHQYLPEDIITNAPDMLKLHLTEGANYSGNKIQFVIDKIAKGDLRRCDIKMLEPAFYVKHKRKIMNAFDFYDEIRKSNPARKVSVIVLYGHSRAGKTLLARAYCKMYNKTFAISSSHNMWDSYRNQDAYILDDVDFCSVSIEEWLHILDGYQASECHARYANKFFVGDTIIISTNIHPLDFFNKSDKKIDPGQLDAFYKRIKNIFYFDELLPEDKVVTYTVKTIEQLKKEREYKNSHSVEEYELFMLEQEKQAEKHSVDLTQFIDFHDEEADNQAFLESFYAMSNYKRPTDNQDDSKSQGI